MDEPSSVIGLDGICRSLHVRVNEASVADMRSMFWTIARCHLRLLAREHLLWLSILLILSTMTYSFAIGRWQLARDRAAESDFLQRAHGTAVRNQQLASAIEQRIEAGAEREIIPPPFGSRHPAYAGAWSRQPALLPSSPLKWLAVGQTDLYPTAFAGPEFDEVSALGNPLKLVRGHLDLSFIAVYLLPLVIIGLSFDVVATERDTGIFQLTLAQGVRAGTILLAKMATVAGVVIGTTAAAFAIDVAFARPSGEMMERVVLGGFAILVYGLFWIIVSLAINALGRSATENLLMLAAAWLGLVVLLPFAIDRIASLTHPVPPISTLIDANRAAPDTVPTADPRLVKAFLAHHPEVQADGLSDLGRLYLNRAARREELERLDGREHEKWEEALRAQETLANRLAAFTPAASLTHSLIELAGTGRERYLDFLNQKRDFEHQYEAFFFPRRLALPDSVFHGADYAQIPTMEYREESLGSVLDRAGSSLVQLGLITTLAGIGAAVLCLRGMRNSAA
jgi:ABC-2 type transport system permease protein